MSELVKEIERQLGNDMIEEGNMNAYDVLEIVKNFKQPELDDNQKIVFDWLKEEKTNSNLTAFDCIYSFIYGNPKDLITQIWSELNAKEEAQLLEVFSQWVQEQEERE